MALFAKISASLQFDDKILSVSPLAELLYIRSILFCKAHDLFGEIKTSHLNVIGMGLDYFLEPLRDDPKANLKQLALELVGVALWEESKDGYRIPKHAWDRWQTSREQFDEISVKRSNAGKMGGRPKSKTTSIVGNNLDESKSEANCFGGASVCFGAEKQTKARDRDRDRDREEREKEKGSEEGASAPAAAPPPAPPVEPKQKRQKQPDPDAMAMTFPDSLNTPECRKAASEWVIHRRLKKEPVNELQLEKTLSRFAPLGPARFIAAIDFTISNGWQGLREPDPPRNGKPNGTPGVTDADVEATMRDLRERRARDAEIEGRNGAVDRG